MTWARIRASRLAAPERLPWYAIAVCAVVFLGLVVASAVNYSGVTMAHVNTSLYVTSRVTLTGTNATGVLTDSGSVTVLLNLSVDNPSPRTLLFDSVSYKVWIEDPFVAAMYYLVFLSSLQASDKPIPPWSNTSLALSATLTRASDPSRFDNLQALQWEVVNRTGSAAGLGWTSYVLLSLPIVDVPPAAVTAASYQFNVNRVILSWGADYGIGVSPFAA